MKDYSAMSDYLINQHVAESLTGRYLYFPDYVWDSEEEKRFDPCNNSADAWPIILSERISIEHDGDCWRSDLFNENGGYEAESDSPLRAAMTVFLMMKDAEKCDG
ncbi:phage protein NinX family protein [Rahnella inusitata]|uniref:phage protein NinX family protein n=1 Tax=Rahnella inusitata TaxID=58169 RepID=UPI0039BDD521